MVSKILALLIDGIAFYQSMHYLRAWVDEKKGMLIFHGCSVIALLVTGCYILYNPNIL